MPRRLCNAHSSSRLSYKVGNIVFILQMEKKNISWSSKQLVQVPPGSEWQSWGLNPKWFCTSYTASAAVVFVQHPAEGSMALTEALSTGLWSSWKYRAQLPHHPGRKKLQRGEKNLTFMELTIHWRDGSDTSGGANRTNAVHHENSFKNVLCVGMTTLIENPRIFSSVCFRPASLQP